MVKPGQTVKVGDVLMTFTVEDAVEETKAEAKKLGKTEDKQGEAPDYPSPTDAERRTAARREAAPPPAAAQEAASQREGPIPAAPSTRRLARELDVELREVPPTGPAGLVTAEDVQSFAANRRGKATAPSPVQAPHPSPERPSASERPYAEGPTDPVGLPDFSQWGPIERTPLRSVRRATSRHMTLAWSQIPHVTHQDVVDITELEAFRRKHRTEVESQGGALSLTVFALKAAVAALKAFPRFNSSLDTRAEEIILKQYHHIGVAVDTERGLIVPVIRDVDRKSITELAKELRELTQRTREGKVQHDEMTGGTFTITNIGPLGGTGFTPIINTPQVAILGMAQGRLQPVVQGTIDNFRVVPRLMMPLCLGFDHRVLDGADAARFLGLIMAMLANPEKLLMG
jgi:pyruvate dehydrogenase E2 component (dihydrolipoamide acetyltransferase)